METHEVSSANNPEDPCNIPHDVALLRDLIQTGNAHPNDTTTDNPTLIYVTVSGPYR